MNAGTLTKKIKIYKPVTIKTETGSETTTWNLIHDIHSRLIKSGGSRTNENGDIFFTNYITFIIRRFYKDVTPICKIEYNGSYYRILNIISESQEIRINTELINE